MHLTEFARFTDAGHSTKKESFLVELRNEGLILVIVVFFSCQHCSICCLVNRRGDPLGVSRLESILIAPRLSWTGSGGYTRKHMVYANKPLFLVTYQASLNLANSIKCVGYSYSYLSYVRSLLCAPDETSTWY